jgi:hypothetical protein
MMSIGLFRNVSSVPPSHRPRLRRLRWRESHATELRSDQLDNHLVDPPCSPRDIRLRLLLSRRSHWPAASPPALSQSYIAGATCLTTRSTPRASRPLSCVRPPIRAALTRFALRPSFTSPSSLWARASFRPSLLDQLVDMPLPEGAALSDDHRQSRPAQVPRHLAHQRRQLHSVGHFSRAQRRCHWQGDRFVANQLGPRRQRAAVDV